MRKALLAVLMLLPGVLRAERFTVKDAGDFAPSGRPVEFADRYGWRSYQAVFEFSLDEGGHRLSRDSKLTVRIVKRDGKAWSYACRAKDRLPLTANVNFLIGKGINVVAECRIPENEFAKAVGLDKEDVGLPNLVFQALIEEGKARPGTQRGMYFLPGGQLGASEMNAYAAAGGDPSSLAVVFRSN